MAASSEVEIAATVEDNDKEQDYLFGSGEADEEGTEGGAVEGRDEKRGDGGGAPVKTGKPGRAKAGAKGGAKKAAKTKGQVEIDSSGGKFSVRIDARDANEIEDQVKALQEERLGLLKQRRQLQIKIKSSQRAKSRRSRLCQKLDDRELLMEMQHRFQKAQDKNTKSQAASKVVP